MLNFVGESKEDLLNWVNRAIELGALKPIHPLQLLETKADDLYVLNIIKE